MVPSATLDTNVLVEFWKNQAKVLIVVKLLDLAQDGLLNLAISSRVREDIPHPPLANRIEELPVLNVSEEGSVSRLGSWVLGRDRLGDGRFERALNCIVDEYTWSSKKPPPDLQDQDHIHTHYLLGRDVFLTWDKQVLRISSALHDKLGMVVMRPEEFLSGLDKRSESLSE